MLPLERHRLIVELLGQHGVMRVNEIAQATRVSRETIRRDLSELERKGILTRSHGGALAAENPLPATRAAASALPVEDSQGSFQHRTLLHSEGKMRVARKFYVMRLLLGAAEAGLYPGIIYYLTLWFGREERAKATGLFLLGVCLANIIGAPLCGLLLSLDGMSGWHGWQWMFFIEGLPAIALAFVVWRRLPDKPADARWLDSDDVQAINAVLAKEAEETRHTPSRFSLKTALSTRVFLLLVLIYFTHQFSVYGLSYFLPGIIGSWGQLTPLQIGLLTAIPWIAAAAGGILLPRFARTEQRSRSMLMAGYLVMATGMAIGAIAGHGVALLGFSLAAFMFFAMQSIIFNWLPSIMSGHMLAGSFGLLNCLGLCGGFLGPFILGAFEDRTGAATSGLWFAVALLIIGALVSLFLKSSSSPGSVSAKQAHGEKV